jgi:hypothetical protein
VTNYLRTLGLVVLAMLVLGAAPRAQEPAKAPAFTPVRVQVVVSKYQGEKKTSSLPYTMSINVGPRVEAIYRASVRIGAQVPIITTAKAGDPPSVQYRDVGTQIDCIVNILDDGRFKLDVSIDDSSVYTDDHPAQAPAHMSDRPTFRSFRSSDSILLKDGQTAQYTAATDKVSGETVKVDVTLTVVR